MLANLDSSDLNQQPRGSFQSRTVDDRLRTLSNEHTAARLHELASKLGRLLRQYRREYHSKLSTDHSSGEPCNC